jgi:hypothetical protein
VIEARALAEPPAVIDARGVAARVGLPAIVNVTTPSGVTVEAALSTMTATLTAEQDRLAMTPRPASLEALGAALVSSRQALATAIGPVSTSPMFLARIQRIRRSTLDSSLGMAETELAV